MGRTRKKNPYTETEMVDFLWKAAALQEGENLLIPVPDKYSQIQLINDLFRHLAIMEEIAPDVAKNIFVNPYFHVKRLWVKLHRIKPQQTYFIISGGEVKKLNTTA